MKHFIILCMSVMLVCATPQTFRPYAQEYATSIKQLTLLKEHPYFKPYEKVFNDYTHSVRQSFDVGYQLDNAIATHNGECAVLKKSYLQNLRLLKKGKTSIEYIYEKALNDAMIHDDVALFKTLVKAPMTPLFKPRMQRKVIGYYKSQKHLQNIELLDRLCKDLDLEAESRAAFRDEQEAYEEHLSVIREEDVKRLREMRADKRHRNVIVSTQVFDGGYHFNAENLNAYEVTIQLRLDTLENFQPSLPLPLVVELKAGEKRQILDVTQRDTSKRAQFKSHFSWAMGAYSAIHDDTYLYALPFKKGTQVAVSQGYNGAVTHKGLGGYATDFSVAEGTPIYAARSGKVVAVKSDSTEGGFSKAFRSKANYIVIEHSDRTLGKYYHLKYDGVLVSVGQNVVEGEKIGYSGNTGYSSGPHLHFSVSKVDEKTYKRSKTIPTRFKTQAGIITKTQRGQLLSVK